MKLDTALQALRNFEALMKLPGPVDARAWKDSYTAIGQPAQQPAGQPAKVTDEQYAAMTGAEKFAYARGFQQLPLDHGRRR
jgi:hypothetical protein